MTDIERREAAWEQAVDWLMREHEESFDGAALRRWLAAAPAHRKAYEQARTLWLVTGLVPTGDEQNDPPSDDG